MSDDDLSGADLEGAYATYDGFLKTAIKTYWEKKGDRVNFISLLLASREAWEVAWDEVRQPGTPKKLLTGAAGAAAVVVVLRIVLGGPVGLILTGASVASLGALYARNHKRIWAQQDRYKAIIGQYRIKHQQVRTKFVDGDIDADERSLMIDGLLRRFLDEVDKAPELETKDDADDNRNED
ncbi:MAG: hypothetical protein AB7S26_01880 [Sandaracinaceae bacterium]